MTASLEVKCAEGSPLRYVLKRIARFAWRLRLGALMLSLAMNGFYGLKNLRGNLPADMGRRMSAEMGGRLAINSYAETAKGSVRSALEPGTF